MIKKDRALKAFGQGSVELAKLLDGGEHFDVVEQTLIENHFLMIQLSYIAWKHRRDKTQS